MGSIFEEYKEKNCPNCIHNNDKNYQNCKITKINNTTAICTDYKEKENNGGN